MASLEISEEGSDIDEMTTDLKAATTTEDITHPLGVIPRGSVDAQHAEWTSWSDGKPLIIFHAMYTTGDAINMDPAWDWGKTRYRIVIEGDPPSELTLEGVTRPDGTTTQLDLGMTDFTRTPPRLSIEGDPQ